MTPAWLPPERVVPFVANIAGMRPDFGRCQTAGVIDRFGVMVAGLIFHNYEPDGGVIEISASAIDPKWATRTVIRFAMNYCFNIANCQMVVTRYSEHNDKARRLWAALGANEHVIPRLRGRNHAEAIATLTDDAWANSKFMRLRDG